MSGEEDEYATELIFVTMNLKNQDDMEELDTTQMIFYLKTFTNYLGKLTKVKRWIYRKDWDLCVTPFFFHYHSI